GVLIVVAPFLGMSFGGSFLTGGSFFGASFLLASAFAVSDLPDAGLLIVSDLSGASAVAFGSPAPMPGGDFASGALLHGFESAVIWKRSLPVRGSGWIWPCRRGSPRQGEFDNAAISFAASFDWPCSCTCPFSICRRSR